MQNKIIIGKITTSHGVKGNVKIESFCEPKENIFKYKNITDKNNKKFVIKRVGTLSSQLFIASIEGITTKNDSDLLRNTDLYINKEELQNTVENSYYINNLIGLQVIDVNDEKNTGTVIDLQNYGAGYIIEIKWNNGKNENYPFSNDYVKEIKGNIVYVNKPNYL